MVERIGMVYLIGAGPGDPELITSKGLRLLRSCDVVIYDRLSSEELLQEVRKDCVKICVGKTPGNHSVKQEEINQILVEKAKEYKVIVRLKGGDPFVFGRGGEEVLTLQENGIPYEIIPGVTSAIAVAEAAGIPVTHRGISRSFHVITGHTADNEFQLTEDYESLAGLQGTLIFLMGISNLDKIIGQLIAYGKSKETPVAIISNGTTPEQKMVKGTLLDIVQKVEQSEITSPAVIVIGDVVNLDMSNTIPYELKGVRVGINGTEDLLQKLDRGLLEKGATVEKTGVLRIVEYPEAITKALQFIEQFSWVVFTSSTGVHLFFANMQNSGIDHRKLGKIRFAVIGAGTSEALRQYGYIADYIPPLADSHSLANGLIRILREDDQLLLVRAVEGSESLPNILKEQGIYFEDAKIYDCYYEPMQTAKYCQQPDYMMFSSASAVNGFISTYPEAFQWLENGMKAVCIGEVTANAFKMHDAFCRKPDLYSTLLVADEASVQGLICKICEDRKKER